MIVMAEGLAEYLPHDLSAGVARDEHGHIAVSQLNLCRLFSKLVADKYTAVTGSKRKITGLQIGYEARCAAPHAFDVMLGSQLGVGAYRALVEERLNGVMVSVSGQLDLNYVPFEKLVDPETLVTMVRYVRPEVRFPPAGPVPGNLRQRVRLPAMRPRTARARRSAAERPLGARHAGHARIGFDGHAQCPGRGFEDRFAHVVVVAAVVGQTTCRLNSPLAATACQKSSTSSLSKSPILAVLNGT